MTEPGSPTEQQEQPTSEQIAAINWEYQRQQSISAQMRTISDTLDAMVVQVSIRVSRGEFPDAFRDYVKKQCMLIAAQVEVQK